MLVSFCHCPIHSGNPLLSEMDYPDKPGNDKDNIIRHASGSWHPEIPALAYAALRGAGMTNKRKRKG